MKHVKLLKSMVSLRSANESTVAQQFGKSLLICLTFYRLQPQSTIKFSVCTLDCPLHSKTSRILTHKSLGLRRFLMRAPSQTSCGRIQRLKCKVSVFHREVQVICLVKTSWLNSCTQMTAREFTELISFVKMGTSSCLGANLPQCGPLQTTATDLII